MIVAAETASKQSSRAVRALIAGNLVNSFGNGLFMTVSAIYFTRSVGLTAAQLALALAVAGGSRLVASAPTGHLADRYGPREVLVVAACLNGIITGTLVLVSGPAWLVVAMGLQGIADSAGNSARGALVAGSVPADQRVRTQSILRSVTNLGITLGAAVAGIALHLDTATAYRSAILGDALTFVVAGVVILAVPRLVPVPAPPGTRRLEALRDRPYLAVMFLAGVLGIQYGLIEVTLPLWLVQRTEAPRWMVSVLLVVNTLAVVLFQVRASRNVRTVHDSGRALRRAGFIIAVACAVFALASGQPAIVAAVVLVAGALVQVTSELLFAAGTWGLAFGLAPAHAQGQYQGIYGMSLSLGAMVGPALTTSLVLGAGRFTGGWPGWLGLALIFLAAGLAVPPVTRWALATR
ncbi:MFS transporter [Fodinicola acaciae]|uniref:MFS transporter n=1 Tax=Fodinicola acaciae TaxID=2681555 RepID=UPI001C9E31CF|nr:MFS transporter [Fodinicola acaciae]